MASELLIHDVVLFNRVKSGNTYVYVATNLKNCLFFKNTAISDSQIGNNLSSTGTCLIPAFSLSAKTFVPPFQWQSADLEEILGRQLVTLACNDIVAKGESTEQIMTVKDIMSSFDTITIRSILVDDFSDNKCYLIKGV